MIASCICWISQVSSAIFSGGRRTLGLTGSKGITFSPYLSRPRRRHFVPVVHPCKVASCHSSFHLHHRRQRVRQQHHQRPISHQRRRPQLPDLPAPRQRLLSEDQKRNQRHRRHVHHPQREQDHEQQPAAAQAVRPVLQPHPERTAVTVPPRAHDELYRR